MRLHWTGGREGREGGKGREGRGGREGREGGEEESDQCTCSLEPDPSVGGRKGLVP